MPNYEFKCKVCGKNFDVLMSINEEHTAKHCGKFADRVWGFNTHQDKRYEFVDWSSGTPTEIRSQKQYHKHLASIGMYEQTKDDRKGIKPTFDRNKLAKELAKKTCDNLQKKEIFQRFREHKEYYKSLTRGQKIAIQKRAMEIGNHACR